MKRTLAILLTLVMVFATFSCAFASAEVPELKGPGNVTLKRLGYNVAFDPNEDIGGKIIKEATGYDTEWYMLPAENADEKLLVEVGSGNYDAINVNVNQWRTLVAQGALQPLDELLETYGQRILEGNSETVWGALTAEDGHIYGVPYMYPHSREIAMFMIARMDLLKAAGIETVPTTIDEFYNCLVTLKEFYGDEYIILAGPFLPSSEGNENWVIPKTIACAFGIYNDWMVNEETGEVYYMTEAEGFPAMVEFLTKLYKEGLIDPDWANNTESALKEKFTSGKAIITCGNRTLSDFCSAALIESSGLSWDDLDYISALRGEDGLCTYQSTEAFNFITGIPRSSQNAADVVNWWNKRVENQLFITIGEEGVHFNYDEAGQISPINPIFAQERGSSYWYMDVSDQKEFEFEWPSRVRKSEGQWHAFSRVTMNADESIFVPNYFAFMPAKENYTTYNTSLFKSLQDYILQVLSGTRTIEDLPTFMKDWTNNGGEDVRSDLQTWYDEFYGAKA